MLGRQNHGDARDAGLRSTLTLELSLTRRALEESALLAHFTDFRLPFLGREIAQLLAELLAVGLFGRRGLGILGPQSSGDDERGERAAKQKFLFHSGCGS